MDANDDITRVLLLGDSRCKGLCDKIKAKVATLGPDIPIYTEGVHQGGLQIFDLLDLLKAYYRSQDGKYNFLYFLGGINNLSEKHSSGKITARYDDVGHLVSEMFDKLNLARDIMFKYSYRPIICQLVDLNFDKYNELEGDQLLNQKVIHEGIPLLNHAINSLNTDIKAASPWLGSTVHAVIHKNYDHKYMGLHDGLHFTDEMQDLWTKQIAKNYSWT